ncbi:MAG: DUF721 domain-containing protein [Aestuariivirga sp.]|uniref:DUF721 domain-containing protein n=1 Tax=Aestuariivirga sp. TaxID=2650926 RepID=UPI0025C19E7B|nr:DciA family protein [Aestuariivirga sp.]MCA3559426.1 DUF721 domain-containing protein [Aestuariivirga sp.]
METLSKHFREITKAAFARYGFAQADVVANWDAIVGGELAAVSAPERIKWPRGSGEEASKQGGTLVIRAAPGRALELQYEASRIISRINSFFGYGAVANLKVMQAAELGKSRPKPPALPVKPVHEQELNTVDDPSLRAALVRLGRGVAGSSSSPQGK